MPGSIFTGSAVVPRIRIVVLPESTQCLLAGAEEVEEEEEETRIGESLFCLFGRRRRRGGKVKRGEGILSSNHGTGKNHNQDSIFFT